MKKLILLLTIFLGMFSANAQQTQEELANEAANPLADIISLPFQNNLNMNYGEFNRNLNVLNIQPVIPLAGGKVITRTIMPIVTIPDFGNKSGNVTTGLSDIVLTAFYVPESKGLMYGFGPVFELPTGGSIRGTQKWSAGPSLVVLSQSATWTIGGLVNNTWSFAGDSDRGEVNHMLLNLFVVRQLGKGWYVNSAPIITADWTAESDDQWVVPVGLGAGKVMLLGGKLPLNVQTGLYNNVVRPDFGPEWQWRVQAQIMLPKSLLGKK